MSRTDPYGRAERPGMSPFCTKLTSIKIRRMDDGTELLAGPGT